MQHPACDSPDVSCKKEFCSVLSNVSFVELI